jgi:iron complex outermembrane receptor protein
LNTVLNLPTVINAGSARIRGAELELQAVAARGLTMNSSVAYLDDRLLSINPTANDGGVPITLGDRLPFAPRWKFSASVEYTYGLTGGAQLVGRVDGDYTTRTIFSIGNQPHAQQGPVGLLNASVTYHTSDGHVEFVVGGRNLADRFYYTNGFQDQRINGVATNTIAEPRTGYATIRWHY